jgi:hypothetical protein
VRAIAAGSWRGTGDRGRSVRIESSAFDQLRTDRLNSVLMVVTVMLVALALVNAIFIT